MRTLVALSLVAAVSTSLTGCLDSDVGIFGYCDDDDISCTPSGSGTGTGTGTGGGTGTGTHPPGPPAHFMFDRPFGTNQDAAIAVGGSVHGRLLDEHGLPYPQPVTILGTGSSLCTFEAGDGSELDVQMPAEGLCELTVYAGSSGSVAHAQFAGLPLSDLVLMPTSDERLDPARPIAFAPGSLDAVVGLYSSGPSIPRLIDSSTVITLDGLTNLADPAEHWDLIALAEVAPGTYSVEVTAGDLLPTPLTLDVVVPTQIEPQSDAPTALVVGAGSTSVCFAATAAAFQVSGLAWSITASGAALAPITSATNCISIPTDQPGSVTLTLAAGDLSATRVLLVAE